MTSMVALSGLSHRQLSLGLWPEQIDNSAEIRQLKFIGRLEREAEAALFDWTEGRDAPDATRLWRVFTLKAQLLNLALAERSQSIASMRQSTNE